MNAETTSSTRLLDPPRLREWSQVRPWAGLVHLFLEYVCVALVAGAAIEFHLLRGAWGLGPFWEVGVILVAAFLVGCLQHRIGLIGHEASHGLLVPDRFWNDRLANLLIFYPLFSSISMYRKRHLSHHLHPNDPEHDLNLSGGKLERIWARFPMSKERFTHQFFLKFFWPPFVLRNLLDLFSVLAVENKNSAANRGAAVARPGRLGAVYFVVVALVLVVACWQGSASWGAVSLCYMLALMVWAVLPSESFPNAGRFAGSSKTAALLRLSFSTLLILGLGWLAQRFGGWVIWAYCLLWVFPLVYVFPYLMLLREIYQHANAGTGAIDNSRILHVDPFTRWALLGYGNDLHVIHHLYPNIPHDRLAEVHETLMRESGAYRENVQQTYGVMRSSETEQSLLDSFSVKRVEK